MRWVEGQSFPVDICLAGIGTINFSIDVQALYQEVVRGSFRMNQSRIHQLVMFFLA
jgi:hypothetical protein